MKTLKVKSILFSLLAMLIAAVFLTSCGQENIVEEDLEGLLEQPTINFISAEQSTDEVPDISELIESTQDENLALRGCNCGAEVNSVEVYQWGPLTNLMVDYRTGEPGHMVRILHFRQVSTGWKYVGYNLIPSTVTCIDDGAGLGTGALPSDSYWSFAQIYEPSSDRYCGSWKNVKWSQ